MLLVPWHSMNFMSSTKGSEVVVSFWVGVVGTWEITVLNLLYFVEGSGAGSGTQYAAICHRAAPQATCLLFIYLISLGNLFPFWSLGSSLGRYCIYILRLCSCYVAQANLQYTMTLPQLPNYQDHRHAIMSLNFFFGLGNHNSLRLDWWLSFRTRLAWVPYRTLSLGWDLLLSLLAFLNHREPLLKSPPPRFRLFLVQPGLLLLAFQLLMTLSFRSSSFLGQQTCVIKVCLFHAGYQTQSIN